jgi:hypothetical protein
MLAVNLVGLNEQEVFKLTIAVLPPHGDHMSSAVLDVRLKGPENGPLRWVAVVRLSWGFWLKLTMFSQVPVEPAGMSAEPEIVKDGTENLGRDKANRRGQIRPR